MTLSKSNELKLQNLVNNTLNSCSGTSWEKETILKLRKTLKNELGLRDVLIDRFLNNHFA